MRRTTMCNCTSEKLEIPRCAIAHLRSGPSDHPGMTSVVVQTLYQPEGDHHANDIRYVSAATRSPAALCGRTRRTGMRVPDREDAAGCDECRLDGRCAVVRGSCG